MNDVLYPAWPEAPPARVIPPILPQTYDWAQYNDGETHLLWSGTDYFVATSSARTSLWKWADRNDFQARSRAYRFMSDQTGETRECLAVQLLPGGSLGFFTIDLETGEFTYDPPTGLAGNPEGA